MEENVCIASKGQIEAANRVAKSWIPVQGDQSKGLGVNFDDYCFKARYIDEHTREELPLHVVKVAMFE